MKFEEGGFQELFKDEQDVGILLDCSKLTGYFSVRLGLDKSDF
jgi:hypothetical protein